MGALLESSYSSPAARERNVGLGHVGPLASGRKDLTPKNRGTRSSRTTVNSTAKAELSERDSVISQTVLQETEEQHSNF